MSPPQQLRQRTSNCNSLLIYRPRKDERLSWPSWLTYSGWFTHISRHPSATGWYRGSCSTSRPRLVTLDPMDPAGAPKYWRVHNLCNAFLVHRLAEGDEIWHDEGHLCAARQRLFWWTSVHYWLREHKFSTADMSYTSFRRVTKFGTIEGLANIWHLFPDFRELWPGDPQYRAAICTSPILMLLFYWLL